MIIWPPLILRVVAGVSNGMDGADSEPLAGFGRSMVERRVFCLHQTRKGSFSETSSHTVTTFGSVHTGIAREQTMEMIVITFFQTAQPNRTLHCISRALWAKERWKMVFPSFAALTSDAQLSVRSQTRSPVRSLAGSLSRSISYPLQARTHSLYARFLAFRAKRFDVSGASVLVSSSCAARSANRKQDDSIATDRGGPRVRGEKEWFWIY